MVCLFLLSPRRARRHHIYTGKKVAAQRATEVVTLCSLSLSLSCAQPLFLLPPMMRSEFFAGPPRSPWFYCYPGIDEFIVCRIYLGPSNTHTDTMRGIVIYTGVYRIYSRASGGGDGQAALCARAKRSWREAIRTKRDSLYDLPRAHLFSSSFRAAGFCWSERGRQQRRARFHQLI